MNRGRNDAPCRMQRDVGVCHRFNTVLISHYAVQILTFGFALVNIGPDAIWLEKHYAKIHSTSGNSIRQPPTTFLAVFVGCNKGFDALNALRMGSGNPVFDKGLWNDAMTQHGKLPLHRDVCNEVTRPQFDLPLEHKITMPSVSSSSIFPQVHCIEPMPATARGKGDKCVVNLSRVSDDSWLSSFSLFNIRHKSTPASSA